MSLPASQQRALNAIDTDLRRADIRLASMFSVFTELTRLDKMPLAETYPPVRWWTRSGRPSGRARTRRRPASRLGTIMLIPLLLAATLSLLLLTMLTTRPTGSGRCAQTAAFMPPVRLAATAGCAYSGQPHSSPAGG